MVRFRLYIFFIRIIYEETKVYKEEKQSFYKEEIWNEETNVYQEEKQDFYKEEIWNEETHIQKNSQIHEQEEKHEGRNDDPKE